MARSHRPSTADTGFLLAGGLCLLAGVLLALAVAPAFWLLALVGLVLFMLGAFGVLIGTKVHEQPTPPPPPPGWTASR